MSRGAVSNLTRLRIGVCARLCARSPSVMRHKVCLSAQTRCFGASPTSSTKPCRLEELKKRAMPPPFSRSACGLRQAAQKRRKLCQSSSSFIGCFFSRRPFLWVSSPLNCGWKGKLFFFASFVLSFRNPSMLILGNGSDSRRQKLAVENRIRHVL